MDKYKVKVKKEEYELDDFEFLLIQRIDELIKQIRVITNK